MPKISGYACCFCCLFQVCGGLPDSIYALCILCFVFLASFLAFCFGETDHTRIPTVVWSHMSNAGMVWSTKFRRCAACLLVFVSGETANPLMVSPLPLPGLFFVCAGGQGPAAQRGGCKDNEVPRPLSRETPFSPHLFG